MLDVHSVPLNLLYCPLSRKESVVILSCSLLHYSLLLRAKQKINIRIIFLFFLLLWQIRPSDLFPFRINSEMRILLTVGRTLWTGDQPIAMQLPT
jgi:hypothetical protein